MLILILVCWLVIGFIVGGREVSKEKNGVGVVLAFFIFGSCLVFGPILVAWQALVAIPWCMGWACGWFAGQFASGYDAGYDDEA